MIVLRVALQIRSTSPCKISRVWASRAGKGLVHEEDGRIGRERARDGAALAHAARKLVREPSREAPKVHLTQELLAPRGPRRRREALELQRKFDVVAKSEPREERRILEDDGPVRTGTSDFDLGAAHVARGGLRKACDQVQNRRLAAAGRTQQTDELARGDLQRDAPQDPRRCPPRSGRSARRRAQNRGSPPPGGEVPRRRPTLTRARVNPPIPSRTRTPGRYIGRGVSRQRS